MYSRIGGIVLVAFIATVATDEVWNGFVASWDQDTSTHFYDLPQTLEAAKNEGWTTIEGVNPAEGITPLAFEGDPTFVLLFNNTMVIGFQVAFRVADVNSSQPLKWDELDVIIRKTFNNESFYTSTAYFWNDESTDNRTILIQEKDGFFEVPTNTSQLISETEYLSKKCVPTMGHHYYTWHNTSDCETVFPWLVLGHEGNVIGLGFQAFGTISPIGNRVWCEWIPALGIYTIMNDPPECAYEAIREFGIISLHVWFKKGPQEITCN